MFVFRNESTFKRLSESGREQEFDRLFDEAVIKVKQGLGKTHPIFINGKEVLSREYLEEYSPIDHSVIGRFQKGGRIETKMAISAAKMAYAGWAAINYRERAKLMRAAADLFARDKFKIAAILSIENGKSRYESIGEVDEAIDFLRYYSDDITANRGYARKTKILGSAKGQLGFQGSPGGTESITIRLEPYGVFGVIAPFNFPISISVGMSAGALITGNTVVFKPSSTDNMTMLTGIEIYRIFKEAGLPDGVFNIVTGPGSEVGDELASNPDVSGIAFTGSKNTGIGMISKNINSGQHKIFVVEMGGKNPAIVSKHAEIDSALNGIVSAAFGYSGQKCSALARVYVHKSIKDEFMSRLVEHTRRLQIGDPLKKENYIGPMISESAYNRYAKAIEEAKKSGRLIYGGNKAKINSGGHYVEPAIVEVDHESPIMHTELFAPILAITTYDSIEDALRMANDVDYGLCASFYSKNKKEIDYFSNNIMAGVVYINRASSATTGAIVGKHTFVGWKWSGLTGKGTGSRFYLQQFMREQSLSVSR